MSNVARSNRSFSVVAVSGALALVLAACSLPAASGPTLSAAQHDVAATTHGQPLTTADAPGAQRPADVVVTPAEMSDDTPAHAPDAAHVPDRPTDPSAVEDASAPEATAAGPGWQSCEALNPTGEGACRVHEVLPPRPHPPVEGPGDDDDDHTGPGGHHGPGPYINVDAIPLGDPGMSERLVGSGGQVPQPSDDGAFRTVCRYSHMNFDDPIVYPGQPGAAHLHTFFGNTAVTAHTTQESLMSTGNSTCRGGIANRSAYWIPSMIDADGVPLAPNDSHFYYKSGWDLVSAAHVSPFPEGLRVLAGADMSDPETPSSAVRFSCHSEAYNIHSHIPTHCNPGGELGISIAFPMCWVGYDSNGDPILDSPDHRSHMSYLTHSATCPATHPVRLPEVTFNILYDIPAEGTTGWRLSSDTYDDELPGGYSMHGDWFVGWEQAIVDEFVEGCVNASVDCGSHMLGGGRYLYDTYY